MKQFNKEKIVIFGGAGLLGSAVADGLADMNACPIIVDTNVASGSKVVDKIIKKNQTAEFYRADLSKVEDIVGIIDAIEIAYGEISAWVLSFYPRTDDWGLKLEDMPMESWRANVDMHMNGICLCASEVAKRMAHRAGGSIVTIGSIYGIVAPNFRNYEGTNMTSPAAYSAIKGGVSAYTKYLASYYGLNNVRVNTVIPGGIINNQAKEFLQLYNSKTCLGRLARPSEVANAVIFLLSDDSSYIAGIDLPVDGGYLAL